MSEGIAESKVSVLFHPQEWVDSSGETHHRNKKQLIPADDRDLVTYTVPKADATDDAGIIFVDESYEANLLQAHSVAPAWVNDWGGPYCIRTEER